jgi:hypothetical protein
MAAGSPFVAVPPEVDLLLRSASVAGRRVDDGARLASLDWTVVLAMARRHGVLPLLHTALDGEPAVPDDVRLRLGRHFGANAARNRGLWEAREELAAALAVEGIHVVPLRSAWLPSPEVEVVDIDLLVHRRDVASVTRVLLDLGFAPRDTFTTRDLDALVRTGCLRRFVAPGRVVASLHWNVATAAERLGPSLERLLSTRGVIRDVEQAPLALTRAARLQILCVRGTVNRWQRLTWVRDVALLLGEMAPEEEQAAMVEARAAGTARAVGVGVVLARTLLDAPSRTIDAAARRDVSLMRLAEGAIADIAAPERRVPGRRATARFHLGARERWRDRVTYVVRQALMPTPSDVEAIRLPAILHPLRYLLRPFRLLTTWMRDRRARRAGRQLARFGPTPDHVIDAMLRLAHVTPDDTLLDVGCGDGRIVARAAQQVGCRAIGIEIEPALAARSRDGGGRRSPGGGGVRRRV